jgi:hypothetical protein
MAMWETRNSNGDGMPDEGAEVLHNLIKQQLQGSEPFDEVEALVRSVGDKVQISQDQIEVVVERFGRDLPPSMPIDFTPRLLVDWGELPQVGRKVSPEFSLLCPAYTDRPNVNVQVDKDLDHDPNDSLRRLEFEDSGIWNFHIPFQMKTKGQDCSPGHYIIDVKASFRSAPENAPRFYRCRIRLKVPDLNSEQGGILEIDGDGQSMVNLQGHNLKQFSKVVLKGGDSSVINLQNSINENANDDESESAATSFEYKLKINTEVQSRLPRAVQSNEKKSYSNAGGLFFKDGRRVLFFSKPRLTFGRSRDNDVVLRFLPRSDEHDKNSRNISRTHLITELTPEGIEVRDESRSGIELDYNVVRERYVVPTSHIGEVCEIQLGVTGIVPESFDLEMTTFGPDHLIDKIEIEFWHDIYCDAVGGRPSQLARESLAHRLDAIRFDRINNLRDEESYVLLFREATIGGDSNRCPIALLDHNMPAIAKIHFLDRRYWLEPVCSDRLPIIENTPLAIHSLTPLTPGVQIQFGTEVATFNLPEQKYLD